MWPNKWLLGRDPEHLNKFFKRNIKCALVFEGWWFSFGGTIVRGRSYGPDVTTINGWIAIDILYCEDFFGCVLGS